MDFIYGSEMIASFDVQVDGNHRWDEDRMCEIDVYRQSLNADGFYVTDTSESLAHVEVPTGDYSDDMWHGSSREALEEVPVHLRQAVKEAVALATAKQGTAVGITHKWPVGEVVWITEHIMPGTVRELTLAGGYVVDMGDTGELDEFPEDKLEPFDRDRYELP